MRTSGIANFKKLYGKIPELTAARSPYTLTINNIYAPADWIGKKYIILTTNSKVGGKNFIMPIIFLITSIILFAVSAVYGFKIK